MDVVVSIQHPAHVHFFKHAIEALEDRGHDVHVYALDRAVTVELLAASDLEYTVLGSRGPDDSVAVTQLAYEYRLWRAARRHDPDVVTAIGGVAAAHVAALLGANSVVFTDTEHATLSNRLAFPFADVVCTPACYREEIGPKQYRYQGYHELAYLHPDRFSPSPDALEHVRVDPDDTFAVLRLIRWNAMHNAGGEGFDDLRHVVDRLESTGTEVLITSETELPASLEPYRATVAPDRMHDLLAYADLFVGESGTMTAESALLGTPAIYAHENDTGLTEELAEYGLVFAYHGSDRHAAALDKAVSILDGDGQCDWAHRRERLLEERHDPTSVIVERLVAEGV